MQRYQSTGLSLPAKLMQKIDNDRGDISRSRFLLRLIERGYKEGGERKEVQQVN